MSESKSVFKGWAIVELMGHVRMAGLVEEATLAGAGVLKIDVPEATDDQGRCHPEFTQYVSPSSLYRLTPTTEEIARSVARHSRPAAVHQWELPRPALPAAADPTPCSGCGRKGLELFTDGKGGWCCADCGASEAETRSADYDGMEPCEGCGEPAVTYDIEGVAICQSCADNLKSTQAADPPAPGANKGDDAPYADALLRAAQPSRRGTCWYCGEYDVPVVETVIGKLECETCAVVNADTRALSDEDSASGAEQA